MAHDRNTPTGRLQALRRAKPKIFPLAPDTIVSAKPMATLLGVQQPTLREWCDTIPELSASGAVIIGGNGIKYEFKPLLTLFILIEYFQTKVAAQAAKNRGMQADTGITLPESEDSVTFEQARGQVNLTVTVVSAAERQGLYCLASDVTAFLEGYDMRVVSGILGVRTKVDPNGLLPAEVRADMDGELRGVAANVHNEIASYIEEIGAGLQQAGTGRAGKAAGQSPILPASTRNRRKAARPAQAA